MIHPNRRFNVMRVASVEELAEQITRCTWTLCTGFDLNGILWLNDSLREDSAQEYAVIHDGRQVESITFGWCSREQAEMYIQDILAGKTVEMGPVSPRIDHPDGTCHLCQ
jgi:hypothetical protein